MDTAKEERVGLLDILLAVKAGFLQPNKENLELLLTLLAEVDKHKGEQNDDNEQ